MRSKKKREMQNQNDELYHFGIHGQKWGRRRFQYEDGSLTPAGKDRYYKGSGSHTVSKEFKRSVTKGALIGGPVGAVVAGIANRKKAYVNNTDQSTKEADRKDAINKMIESSKVGNIEKKTADKIISKHNKDVDKLLDTYNTSQNALIEIARSDSKGYNKAVKEGMANYSQTRKAFDTAILSEDIKSEMRVFNKYNEISTSGPKVKMDINADYDKNKIDAEYKRLSKISDSMQRARDKCSIETYENAKESVAISDTKYLTHRLNGIKMRATNDILSDLAILQVYGDKYAKD